MSGLRRLHDWVGRAWLAPPEPSPRGTWILAGLERLYRLGLQARSPVPETGPIPVISVGSLWAGGTGKTPLAAELGAMVRDAGEHPAIILRGYRGTHQGGPKRIPRAPHAADVTAFGDEACLHAAEGARRVYVAHRRIEGVRLAATDGATVAILDDGMQHRQLARDLEVVSLPAESPLGNRRLLPRGPLREDPSALERADLIVLAYAPRKGGVEQTSASLRLIAPKAEIVAWAARLGLRTFGGARPSTPPEAGAPVGLLCGIGNPRTLKRTIEEAGYRVGRVEAFEDHHRFRPGEVAAVERRAADEGLAAILTTAKDAVRLQGLPRGDRVPTLVARLEIVWRSGDKEKVRSRLLRTLERSGGGSRTP